MAIGEVDNFIVLTSRCSYASVIHSREKKHTNINVDSDDATLTASVHVCYIIRCLYHYNDSYIALTTDASHWDAVVEKKNSQITQLLSMPTIRVERMASS